MNPDDDPRFWAKVDRSSECWVWTGARSRNGYGNVRRGGRGYLSHRFAYALTRGPIPQGLVLDHLCRNRLCVNPDHLEAVTHRENVQRGERATRLACPQGHVYDVVIYRRGGRERRCSACANARDRARRVAARATSQSGFDFGVSA